MITNIKIRLLDTLGWLIQRLLYYPLMSLNDMITTKAGNLEIDKLVKEFEKDGKLR